MNNRLKDKLRPGDQIIAIKDVRFSKHISKEEHHSQRVGDIIMVNNPRIGNSVGGTGINGTSYNGRPNIGLGTSFEDGTYRRSAGQRDHYSYLLLGTIMDESDKLRIEYCITTLQAIAVQGQAMLGDNYPEIVSVIGTLKVVLLPVEDE